MSEKPTQAQQDALRLKIEAAKYRLESARTWAGMGWGHPTLSPVRQQEVLDILTEACALLAVSPAPEVPAPNDDQLALDAATDIMALMYGPLPVGGSVQLQAQVQCRVLDAIKAAQEVPGLLEALEIGLKALNVAVSVYDVQLADRARKGLRQQIAAHRRLPSR